MTDAVPASSDQAILDATRHWVQRAVIGLNLCPFAKSVQVKGQVRYVISDAQSLEEALSALETELKALDAADPEQTDTTLLIFPRTFEDFADFNDALYLADLTVRQLGLEGVLQLASFHPRYRFEGTEPDDIENYTNRAPYPILHVLREASIERAVDAVPDAADIYERNQATLRKLGHAGLEAWMNGGDELA